MTPDQIGEALERAWSSARLSGIVGSASIVELVAHSQLFADAISRACGVDARQLGGFGVDVGTGAGIPGTLLALALPATRWRLVDAGESRCAYARAAVRALGLADRVTVHHGRADDLASEAGWRCAHDFGVARLLAGPADTAELLLPLVALGGVGVVSADLDGSDSWLKADLACLGSRVERVESVDGSHFVVLRRYGDVGASFPRRSASRRRSPLFQ